MDDVVITDLKTGESWVACEKTEEDSDSLGIWEKAFQGLGTELEKPWHQTASWYDFHLHVECKSETEKMVEEILVVHSQGSVIGGIVELTVDQLRQWKTLVFNTFLRLDTLPKHEVFQEQTLKIIMTCRWWPSAFALKKKKKKQSASQDTQDSSLISKCWKIPMCWKPSRIW